LREGARASREGRAGGCEIEVEAELTLTAYIINFGIYII